MIGRVMLLLFIQVIIAVIAILVIVVTPFTLTRAALCEKSSALTPAMRVQAYLNIHAHMGFMLKEFLEIILGDENV